MAEVDLNTDANAIGLPSSCIELRGVEVHNLKQVDLDVPHGRLVVVCGLSGSGKTSLALDTLYAEGQRRYIESFSAYTRQFLEQLEKPAARRIDHIPPAIAVTRATAAQSNRTTVGTATEIVDYLRLMFARIGRVFCTGCGREVRRDTPQSACDRLLSLPPESRFLITFPKSFAAADSESSVADLKEDGFVRLIAGGRTVHLGQEPLALPSSNGDSTEVLVVVDRLTAGSSSSHAQRVRDSLETAILHGDGRCSALVQLPTDREAMATTCGPSNEASFAGTPIEVDGQTWMRLGFTTELGCADCGLSYPEPEPRLFSFNSPLGACPTCEGFGSLLDIDMSLVVPDPRKTLREGAIAPWTTPAYAHEQLELLALAPDFDLPTDVPVQDLTEAQWQLIHNGVPERNFGGLRGFFDWLERHKYKMQVRVFFSRWRSQRTCPACGGDRLRPEALATRVGGKNLAEISRLQIDDAEAFFRNLTLSDWERVVGRTMLEQITSRLGFLGHVGLGYLSLDRTLRTLSGGEAQRVALTSALGSNLVNMLYVLDEPSVGLHPADVDRLIGSIQRLRSRGNTVVVVEHEEAMLAAGDQLIEIGPGAGERGGKVVYQGTFQELRAASGSLTGDFLSGRRGAAIPESRRTSRGRIRLTGARGHNLQNITVEFPLGVLCVVTGVSGSGKSTLVQDTLYPALCRRKLKEAPAPLLHDDIFGDGQIDDVELVDQNPIGRSPRSNPVTYIKAFDEIRKAFAETVDARTHNYTAGHFSFNVDGGRCTRCEGDGYLEIDMQFLADVFMKCGQCGGRRYRQEILAVTYRGKNIAEVLEMTVREAFSFFRGQTKVQARLKRLLDVGLDYLRLGQPANTLSAGEAQRLKLAAHTSAAGRSRTLFILDEPTTGLHFADVVQLLDCFDALLAVGHSLILVEHNLQLLKAADYIIDLGPGAGACGGRVVVEGTPEQVAADPGSLTGRFLARALAGT